MQHEFAKNLILKYRVQFNYWFPIVPDDIKETLTQTLTYNNLYRIRLFAFPLIIIHILISPILYTYASYYALFTQGFFILSLIMFLMTLHLPLFPKDLTTRHRLYNRFTLPFMLIFYLINTGIFMAQYISVSPSTPVFTGITIIMFGSASFLYTPFLTSIVLYVSTAIILILLSWFLLPYPFALANTINTPIMAFLCIVMARMTYILRVQDFIKHQTTEKQKEELISANNLLYTISNNDPLTGIPNRRCFDKLLRQEWNRAFREQTSLALLMIDIDFFKDYNDLFGHQAGDHCLKLVAEALKKSLMRPGDMVARYGGEEFAVILPNTDLAGACQTANNLCACIRELQCVHPSSPTHFLTISIGLTTLYPNPNLSLDEMINRADRALYEAKKAGRNQYVVSAF